MPTTTHLLVPKSYPRKLSIVIPLFNEEAVVPALRAELVRFMSEIRSDAEIILVNDGSTDQSLPLLAAWAAEDHRVKVLHLSRNFGHQLAATAGLDNASGEAVVLIDADLQDPLDVIHQMIEKYVEGYDIVYGQRESRDGESIVKRFTAWCFYRLMRSFVYRALPVDTGDFRLLSRQCVLDLRSMRETHRFLRGMVAWIGYPQYALKYRRACRVAGKTKYPYYKMLSFSWLAATSFSTIPLKFSFLLGTAVGLFSLEEALRAIVVYFLGGTVSGWTSIVVLLGVIGSALLTSVGILGEYLGKIYEEIKGRPLYLVARKFNCEEDVLDGD